MTITQHAARRMQTRGLSAVMVACILDHADLDRDAGGGSRKIQISRAAAACLPHPDKLGRFALIVAADGGLITMRPDRRRRRRHSRRGTRR